MRRLVLMLTLLAVAALPSWAHAAPPPVKHVFIIVLENENFDSTFAPNSKAPYLSKTLRSQGAFLSQYYATAHLSLPNYIAMTSGQGPNPVTQSDCQIYQEFVPGTIGADGQAIGQGCLYPATVKTIADQLEAKGLDWKGYMEDMKTPCRHPAPNSSDSTQKAKVGDQYAARHNPFVYFRSIIDRPVCASNDVPLDRLQNDLASGSVGAYNFITPNLCNDGHDEPCVDGRPGGLVSMDAFLKVWVPRITGSRAYKDGGLLMVTFDEAEADIEGGPSGGKGDARSCCDEPVGPNTPNNGGPVPGNGGGLIGAVMLSPYIAPGTVTNTPYNHYSMLRSMEDLFGLGHLGYAGRAGLKPFGSDVYTRPNGPAASAATRPSVRVTGLPRRCSRSGFNIRVRARGTGIRRVSVKVGRRYVKRTSRARFGMRVKTGRLRPGRHALRVGTVDSAGRRAATTRRFRRCSAGASPAFAG